MTTDNKPLFSIALEGIKLIKPTKATLVSFDAESNTAELSFSDVVLTRAVIAGDNDLSKHIGSAVLINSDGTVILKGKKEVELEKKTSRTGCTPGQKAMALRGL